MYTIIIWKQNMFEHTSLLLYMYTQTHTPEH